MRATTTPASPDCASARGAEAPRRRAVAGGHGINQGAEFLRRDRHHVADVMGEALAGRVAVLNRREHGAEEEHGAVGILMVRVGPDADFEVSRPQMRCMGLEQSQLIDT